MEYKYHKISNCFTARTRVPKTTDCFSKPKKIPGAKKAVLKRYTRTVGLGFKMPTEVRCRV